MVELTDIELSGVKGGYCGGGLTDGYIEAVAAWLFDSQHPDQGSGFDYWSLWDAFDNTPAEPLPASTFSADGCC